MFWNSTIYPKRSALSAYSPFEEQAQTLLAYCHFHSFLIFLFIYHISQRSNPENCFRISGYSVKVRSQVQTITRAILPRNQLPSVSNSQRGWSCKQIFVSSTTFLNPLVGTNSLYGKRTVGFSSLASYGTLYRFLNWFWEKKPTVLQSTVSVFKMIFEQYIKGTTAIGSKTWSGNSNKWLKSENKATRSVSYAESTAMHWNMTTLLAV